MPNYVHENVKIHKDVLNCTNLELGKVQSNCEIYGLPTNGTKEELCNLLSRYLRPNSIKIENLIEKEIWLIENTDDVDNFVKKHGLIIRLKGDIKENSKESYKEFLKLKTYNFKKYGINVFISFRKKENFDIIYNFINEWTHKFNYVDKTEILPDVAKELQKTVKKKIYTLYRGLNFNKKDLGKFYDSLKIHKDYKHKDIASITFNKLSSWTTDSKIAQHFITRHSPSNREKKTSSDYQVILGMKTTDYCIFADLEDDPLFNLNEVIVYPGNYEVVLSLFSNGDNIDSMDEWSTYTEI